LSERVKVTSFYFDDNLELYQLETREEPLQMSENKPVTKPELREEFERFATKKYLADINVQFVSSFSAMLKEQTEELKAALSTKSMKEPR